MEKLDLIKTDRGYYTAKTKPELVSWPAMQYISIVGMGDPSSKAFASKLETLYPVAYALKFMAKSRGKDFGVAKLEGQWWYDELLGTPSMANAPLQIPREAWRWRLLIRMPDFVSQGMLSLAVRAVEEKKKIPAHDVALFIIPARHTVQMMHHGGFDREPDTLRAMEDFILTNQLRRAGLHHEVYLSDFRKTAPAKLRTILREPVHL